MPDNKQPWDDGFKESTVALTAYSSPDYMKADFSGQTETTAGTEKVKYGLGKPVRISIIGDIKHDSDQR